MKSVSVPLELLETMHSHPDCPVEFIDHLRRAISQPAGNAFKRCTILKECSTSASATTAAAQHQGEPVSIDDERAAYEQWQWRRDWPIEQLAGARRSEYFKRKFLDPKKYESERFNDGLSVWLARAAIPVQPSPVAVVMRECEHGGSAGKCLWCQSGNLKLVLPNIRDVSGSSREQAMCASTWNACIAEVAKLNGVAP